MAQHPAEQTLTPNPSHITVNLLGRVGKGEGLHVRYMLQVQLTLKPGNLHCVCCHSAVMQSPTRYTLHRARAFRRKNVYYKNIYCKISITLKLGCWNNTVVNSAHGIFTTSPESIHDCTCTCSVPSVVRPCATRSVWHVTLGPLRCSTGIGRCANIDSNTIN
jgi:hypothetical protein